MIYRIELTPAARRDMAGLPENVLVRVDARILALAENPYPRGAVKIRGEKNIFRVRVGDYRIMYQVEHNRLIVLVIRIAHRREIYRKKIEK